MCSIGMFDNSVETPYHMVSKETKVCMKPTWISEVSTCLNYLID